MVPPPFHWGVFAIGMALGLTALVLGVSRLEHGSGSAQHDAAVDATT
jgi:hypothetical protein